MAASSYRNLFILLSLLTIGSHAIIYKITFDFGKDLSSSTYALFKFKKGGNVTFEPTKIEYSNSNKGESIAAFFLFKKSIWKNKNPYQDEEYGQSATIAHPFLSVNDTYEGTIEEAGWYYAVVSSRDPFRYPVKVTTKTTLFNPGNAKHLSVDDQPRPYMYDVFVGVWVVLLALWVGNWIYVMIASKDKSQLRKKLHLVLSVYVVLKMFSTIFLSCYWNILRNNGNLFDSLVYIYYALYILETISFYGALILISSGWDIIDDKILPRKWPYAAAAIGVYAVVLILTLYVDSLYYVGSIAEMIVLFIIIIMIGARSAKSLIIIYDNLRALIKPYTKKERSKNENENENANENSENGKSEEDDNDEVVMSEMPKNVKRKKEQLERQFKMINIFRYIFIGYLIGKIIVMIVLMIGVDDWIGNLLYGVLDVVVAVAVGITFRLHKIKTKGNYFLLENEFDDDEDDGEEYGGSENNVELDKRNEV